MPCAPAQLVLGVVDHQASVFIAAGDEGLAHLRRHALERRVRVDVDRGSSIRARRRGRSYGRRRSYGGIVFDTRYSSVFDTRYSSILPIIVLPKLFFARGCWRGLCQTLVTAVTQNGGDAGLRALQCILGGLAAMLAAVRVHYWHRA